jgi:hypothetical protein
MVVAGYRASFQDATITISGVRQRLLFVIAALDGWTKGVAVCRSAK